MRTLTKAEARAGSMTKEEAGIATVERAHQIEGSAIALLCREQMKRDDWEGQLKAWAENRPWEFLPDDETTKYGKVWTWTASRLTMNGEPLTRARLVALLAGLLGTVALAETRLQAFELEIAQPLVLANGRPKGSKNCDPGKSFLDQQAARMGGNDTGYLMARLQRIDPDVANKIGKGKPYRSINHAAQELGILARRQRYELNPDVGITHAATRIVEVLGPKKTAELVAKLSQQLSNQ
ncbi:MAG: hypothetical protein R6W92_06260 [Desulfocurvibacter africanus]